MSPDLGGAPRRTHRMRTVLAAALLCVPLALTACSGSSDDEGGSSGADRDGAGAPSSTETGADSGGTVELRLPAARAARCVAPNVESLRAQQTAFAGSVTEVADGLITLRVDQWYAGGGAGQVTVRAPAEGLVELGLGARFEEGGSYLVSASDGEVTLCGLTGERTEELAGLYADAYGDPSTSAQGERADRRRAEALPPVRHPLSLPRLMREDLRAGRIQRTERLGGTDRWTGWAVTYTVDGATVSGELLVPTGRGPFPALVLNHGYIDPAIYTLGRGMSREQEWLAANGFVVLHTDYRGHAGSDPVSAVARETRLAYTRDAIGAVRALQREPYVDDERLGMVGRSMGGGVTYNAIVAQPDLVDAAVVFAPVSSDFVDNLRRWTIAERPDDAQALFEQLGGPPEREPRPYRELSARTYFDRIEVPVLIHHGTSDDSCPIAWSRETQRLLTAAGVDSRLEVYEGEEHAFGPQFERSMRLTVDFLRRQLA